MPEPLEPTFTLSDRAIARLEAALEQSRKGETVDLGDFTQYAED